MANRSKHTEENYFCPLYNHWCHGECRQKWKVFSTLKIHVCIFVSVCIYSCSLSTETKTYNLLSTPKKCSARCQSKEVPGSPPTPVPMGLGTPTQPHRNHMAATSRAAGGSIATLFYSKNACFIIKGQNKHAACSVKHREVITSNPATWTFGILLAVLQELQQERGKIITY